MTHSKDFMCNSALDITGRKVQLSQINLKYQEITDFVQKTSLLKLSPPGFVTRSQAWISCQKTKYHLNADIIELCLDSAQLSGIAL